MSSVRTVKVTNVSHGANEHDIREFFSFSGDVEYVELQSDNELSQIAYVAFKDSQGADTAVLLSGATIVDMSVSIALAPDYELKHAAVPLYTAENKGSDHTKSVFRKAEDVVSSMLAKGYILGKDAVSKAKTFDEKLKLSSKAMSKVASFDKKIGLTEKINVGTTIVSDRVREVDQKFQVSEKTKSAFAAAEQTASTAGSALMKNRYVYMGVTWVLATFNKVARTAEEVSQRAKEKANIAEEEQRRKLVNDFARDHLSEPPTVSVPSEQEPPKSASAQGLVI